mmetsp:Transcript_33763/g.47126  ORF Transcript_33763/g.47126 Transcript_33763/m.47126 type:complete len:131 (+) Transcript_33763:340-732(+)
MLRVAQQLVVVVVAVVQGKAVVLVVALVAHRAVVVVVGMVGTLVVVQFVVVGMAVNQVVVQFVVEVLGIPVRWKVVVRIVVEVGSGMGWNRRVVVGRCVTVVGDCRQGFVPALGQAGLVGKVGPFLSRMK